MGLQENLIVQENYKTLLLKYLMSPIFLSPNMPVQKEYQSPKRLLQAREDMCRLRVRDRGHPEHALGVAGWCELRDRRGRSPEHVCEQVFVVGHADAKALTVPRCLDGRDQQIEFGALHGHVRRKDRVGRVGLEQTRELLVNTIAVVVGALVLRLCEAGLRDCGLDVVLERREILLDG